MKKLQLVSLQLLVTLALASIIILSPAYAQFPMYPGELYEGEPAQTPQDMTAPSLPPTTGQQPENMTSYCAPEYVVCEGEAMPSSRTTNMTNTTNTTATQAAVTTQDPDFERFLQTASECTNSAAFGSSGATMTEEQCTQFLEQGQEKWCGLADYDAQKCETTTRLTVSWNNLVNLSKRFGFNDIPSLGELGIDPRTIAPSP